MGDDAATVASHGTLFAPPKPGDTGLGCLALVLGLAGESFDFDRVRREYLQPDQRSDVEDLIRIARAEGFKARAGHSSLKRLGALPLPVIGRRRDGSFFVIGRLVDGGVLVGEAGGPPAPWSLDVLAQEWTGEVLFVVRRDRLAGEVLRFGLAWFLPVVRRFAKVLA